MKTRFSLVAIALLTASVFAGPNAQLPNGQIYEAGVLRITLKDDFAGALGLRNGAAVAVKVADISELHPAILRVEARHLAARNWLKGAPLPAHLVKKGQVPRIARDVCLVLKPEADTLRVAEEVKARPEVESVSLNFLHRTNALPNDPRYADQWGMNRIGIPDGDWDLPPRGAIRVAIVDTGVDREHPEFEGRIVFGAGYTAEAPANGDAPPDRRNNFDHGTHVAGIAAATRNNNEGVAGVSNNIELMAMGCAVFGVFNGVAQYGIGNAPDAINDAVANGARVINCSFGTGMDAAMVNALSNAHDNNVLVVVSAGNAGLDITGSSWALNAVPFIISASRQANPPAPVEVFDNLFANSNFGPRVDLCAPGGEILSTVPTGGPPGSLLFDTFSGTSMAAPHVAGAAAHLMSMNPELIEDDSAKHLLIRMALDTGSIGKDDFFGHGLLRLRRAYFEVVRSASAFVSNIDNSGDDNGDYDRPWGDVQTGLNEIPNDGVLVLNGGDVSAPSFHYPAMTITKRCTLTALPDSPVTIGQ